MTASRPWSLEEETLLFACLKRGFDWEQCALELRQKLKVGRTAAACSSFASRVMSSNYTASVMKRWTKEDITTLSSLHARGAQVREMCARLDRTRHSVLCKLQELGLGLPGHGGPTRFAAEGRLVLEDELKRGLSFVPFPAGCRFIAGEPTVVGTPHGPWCNKPRIGALPYCQEHALRCYVPPKPSRDQ